MKPIVSQVKLRSPYSAWSGSSSVNSRDRARPSVAIPCSGVQKNYLVGSYCPVVGFHLIGRTDDLTLPNAVRFWDWEPGVRQMLFLIYLEK